MSREHELTALIGAQVEVAGQSGYMGFRVKYQPKNMATPTNSPWYGLSPAVARQLIEELTKKLAELEALNAQQASGPRH